MQDHKKKDIEYVCIGHCCHDVEEDGYTLGGTAAYSASVANSLGAKAKIITAYGSDFAFEQDIKDQGIELINIGSEATTVFENIYGQGARQQVLHSRAHLLNTKYITPYLKKTDILHLCPIADEIDYSLIHQVDAGLIVGTIQGSMRCWDDQGNVYPCNMKWESLKGMDLVVISDEDINGLDRAFNQLVKSVPLVIVTMGGEGAKIFKRAASLFLPSFPIHQKRETGAGDTFASAFFIHYYKNRNPLEACIYAHALCSLVLERNKDDLFPSQGEVERRIQEYHEMLEKN